ncbi:MAG: tetratricopeptide repeat protein [Deltaproteobacteria bacterium]|nr:tetratricopeptide repeat protein [Deltaproteobacteria bacterium]
MLAKLRNPLVWVWGTLLVGIGVNLLSNVIGESFAAFVRQHFPLIGSGFVLLTVVTWRAEKAHRRAEAFTHFSLLTEAHTLDPEQDLKFQSMKSGKAATDPKARPFYDKYIPRHLVAHEVLLHTKHDEPIKLQEQQLASFLRAKQSLTIIGQSREGKTRTLFEVLRLLAASTTTAPLAKQSLWTKLRVLWPDSGDYTVVQPILGKKIPPDHAFDIFKGRHVIVFLNDFHHYVGSAPDLNAFCEAIAGKNKDNAASWVVAATCRDGPELHAVQQATSAEGRFFHEKIRHKLRLLPVEEDAQRRLHAETGKPWNGPYATLGDVVMEGADEEMQVRFTNLPLLCQEVLRALKLCHAAGIRPYTTERLDAVLHHIFKRTDWQSRDALQLLADQSFLDRHVLPDAIFPGPAHLEHLVEYPRHHGQVQPDFPLLIDALATLEDIDGLETLGRVFFANGDEANARACFERVAAHQPEFIATLRARADEAHANKRYQAAMQAWSYLLLLQPEDQNAWYEKGHNLLAHLGHPTEALAAFEKSIELNPKDADAWTKKGICLSGLGRHADAFIAYNHATALNRNHPLAWYNKGICLKAMGRLADALAAFEHATTCNPNHVAAWTGKGVCLREMGRFADALAAYERANTCDSKNTDAWYNKGVCLLDLKRFPEALAACDRVLALDPKDADAWTNKGNCLSDMGRLSDALITYNHATALNRNHPLAWYNKGICLKAMGRLADALAAYEQAIRCNPKDADVWYNKGVCLYDMGRPADALAAYEQAATRNPKDADVWTNRGICLRDLGHHAEALDAHRGATKLDPSNPKHWRLMARTATACGDTLLAEKANLEAARLEREESGK